MDAGGVGGVRAGVGENLAVPGCRYGDEVVLAGGGRLPGGAGKSLSNSAREKTEEPMSSVIATELWSEL